MSVAPITNPSDEDLYCSTEDVAEYFDKYDDFDGTTTPSASRVESRIGAESSWVDNYTGHAWRARQIVDAYHDLEGQYNWRQGLPISLQKRDIRTPLDETEGDKIEIWRGNDYDDFVADSEFKEGRDEDYWVDESRGILYIYRRYVFWSRANEIRLTYRYGQEEVPQIIRDSVARRVAAYYMEADQYRKLVPGNDDAADPGQIAEMWREQSEKDLEPFKEIRSTGLSM